VSLEIQTVPFDGIDQKDAVLSGFQMARVLSVGSSWSTLRIGMRYSLTDAGISLGTGPELWFGLLASPSADMANGPLTATTSHFVGVRLNLNWTRATGPVRYTSNVDFSKRVTATTTSVPVGSTISGADPDNIKQAIVFQMQKSGTNPNLDSVHVTSGGALIATTMTLEGLKNAMNAATMADAETALDTVVAGYSLLDTNSLSVDEAADGNLNAICIAWNSGVAQLHAGEAFFRVVS
jgi:hypothetical protein